MASHILHTLTPGTLDTWSRVIPGHAPLLYWTEQNLQINYKYTFITYPHSESGSHSHTRRLHQVGPCKGQHIGQCDIVSVLFVIGPRLVTRFIQLSQGAQTVTASDQDIVATHWAQGFTRHP